MAKTITVNGVNRTSAIAPKDVEWVESAYSGEVGEGHFVVGDDAGTIVIPGHKAFSVEESTASPVRIASGFTRRKGIRRGETFAGVVPPAAREIQVGTVDLNDLFKRLEIWDTDGNRLAETIAARLTWLLASAYCSTLFADFGAVTYPAIGLDANDCRGSYPGDVLASMAKVVRFNHYLRYKVGETLAELVFRDDNASTADTAAVSISNAGDDNGTTVFAPLMDSELSEDPEHVYSGMVHNHGKGWVRRTRPATATAFAERDGVTDDSGVKTDATANRDADTALWESHLEEQLLPVKIHVRAAQVNAIRAGSRVPVRMLHMAPEGWDPARYARVMRRRVTQSQDTDFDYAIDMDLSPQEAGPPVGQIVQQASAYFAAFGAVMHLPNPPTIGNKLLVAISARSRNDGTTFVVGPSNTGALPYWGVGAWTDANGQVPAGTGVETWVGNTGAWPGHNGVAFFWKDVDDTSQDCRFNAQYFNLTVWELSGADLAAATIVRANDQAAATTFDLGTLGSIAAGELAFMVTHSVTDDALALPSLSPAAGWVEDWYRGNYPLWYATTYPVCWMGHSIGAGAVVDPSLYRGVARKFCGLALKVPAV